MHLVALLSQIVMASINTCAVKTYNVEPLLIGLMLLLAYIDYEYLYICYYLFSIFMCFIFFHFYKFFLFLCFLLPSPSSPFLVLIERFDGNIGMCLTEQQILFDKVCYSSIFCWYFKVTCCCRCCFCYYYYLGVHVSNWHMHAATS